MKRTQIWTVALVAIVALALISTTACKSSGMAVTSRGQFLKLNITNPADLPEAGVDNLDVTLTNAGVNNIQDILLEVELPPQLIVMDQTNERGVNVMHTPRLEPLPLHVRQRSAGGAFQRPLPCPDRLRHDERDRQRQGHGLAERPPGRQARRDRGDQVAAVVASPSQIQEA